MIGCARSLLGVIAFLALANCTPIGLVTEPDVVDAPNEGLPASLAPAYHLSDEKRGELYVSFVRSESGRVWGELFWVTQQATSLLPTTTHFRGLGDGWYALSFDFSGEDSRSQHHVAARLSKGPVIAIDPEEMDKKTVAEIAKKHGLTAGSMKLAGKVTEPTLLALLDELRGEARLKDVRQVETLSEIPEKVRRAGAEALGVRTATAPADDLTSDPAGLASLVDYLRLAAARGDAWAIYNLARFHTNGWGVEKDYGTALRLARQAIDLGQDRAKNLVALMAYNGWGTPKDRSKALSLFREAATAGEPRAMQTLSWLYFNGESVGKDEKEGLAWAQRAVDAGLPDAAYALGRRYLEGDGVAKDAARAFEMFRKAGTHADAQAFLGSMYARGLGTKENQKTAAHLYLKAAKDGQVWAQWQIGERLIEGKGIDRNRDAGLAWLRRAASAGNEGAKKALAQYESTAATPPRAPPSPKAEPEVPPRFQPVYTAVVQQKAVDFTDENTVFAAGMGAYFMEKCKLPSNFADRAELSKFVAAGSTLAAMGNEYANPDLGKAWSDPISGALVYGVGSKVAEQVGCNTSLASRLTGGLLKAIRANASGGDGGASPFVTSCARTYSTKSCSCLADIGRAVVPNIHRMTYHRDIIARIIEGNPLVALQIPMMCGIVNY